MIRPAFSGEPVAGREGGGGRRSDDCDQIKGALKMIIGVCCDYYPLHPCTDGIMSSTLRSRSDAAGQHTVASSPGHFL